MKLFKNQFFHLVIANSYLISVVTIVSSCSEEKKENKKDNIEPSISTAEAKKQVIDLWTRQSLVAINNKSIPGTFPKEKIKDAFENYETLPIKIQTEILALFKLYASLKLHADGQYFANKITEWNTKSLFTPDQITVVNNYSGRFKIPSDDQFKIFYNVSGTSIASEINKMLLSKWYLTKANEIELKNAEKYEDKIKKDSPDYKLYSALDTKQKYYFLIKYLLQNQISESWSYSSINGSKSFITNQSIKVINGSITDGYNQLFKDKLNNDQLKLELRKNFVLNVFDGIQNQKVGDNPRNKEAIRLAKGYIGLKTATKTSGDLSYSLDDLKESYKTRNGLLTKIQGTDKVFSYDDLFLNKIFSENYEKVFRVKKDSIDKIKGDIHLDDFEEVNLPFKVDKNGKSTSEIEKNKDVIIYEKMRKLVVDSISEKRVVLEIKMTVTKNNINYSRIYYQTVSWSTFNKVLNGAGTEITEETHPTKISLTNENNNNLTATYINKIVPLFKATGIEQIDSSNVLMGKFSFDNTPWLQNGKISDELIASLYLSDTNLFNLAKKYFATIGYRITVLRNQTLMDVAKVEGISIKT